MRIYDISPLWRSTIGFDRLFNLVHAAQHAAGDDNYPPCNVERVSDERYRGRSSGSSVWPPTSGSREHSSTMVCSRSS